VRACIGGINNQILIFDMRHRLVHVAAVEFASIWKNAYQVESAGIPDNGDHQFWH
jgi:hypothetical protein